jgi:hemolysin activation/secretion protein
VQRLVHRNALSLTTATLKAFQRQSRNHIADLEVQVQRRKTAGWSLGLNHQHTLSRGSLNSELTYTRGTGAWGALPNPESVVTENPDRAHQIKGQLAWAMPLQFKHPVNYQTQFQWQWSQSPLAPQDQFCIAGRSTVRGFDGQSTLCGERGQLWRQEWNTPLPNTAWTRPTVQAFLAMDAGRATTANLAALPAQRLVGMALGLRGQHTVRSTPVQWELFAGQPLHKPSDMNATATTVGFSLNTEL